MTSAEILIALVNLSALSKLETKKCCRVNNNTMQGNNKLKVVTKQKQNGFILMYQLFPLDIVKVT